MEKEHAEYFTLPLNKNGCKELVSAVLRRAVKDRDVRFFKSFMFTFYIQFLDNALDGSDYIKKMNCF